MAPPETFSKHYSNTKCSALLCNYPISKQLMGYEPEKEDLVARAIITWQLAGRHGCFRSACKGVAWSLQIERSIAFIPQAIELELGGARKSSLGLGACLLR